MTSVVHLVAICEIITLDQHEAGPYLHQTEDSGCVIPTFTDCPAQFRSARPRSDPLCAAPGQGVLDYAGLRGAQPAQQLHWPRGDACRLRKGLAPRGLTPGRIPCTRCTTRPWCPYRRSSVSRPPPDLVRVTACGRPRRPRLTR